MLCKDVAIRINSSFFMLMGCGGEDGSKGKKIEVYKQHFVSRRFHFGHDNYSFPSPNTMPMPVIGGKHKEQP